MHILAFWLNMLITSEKNNYTSQPVTNVMGLPSSEGGWFSQSQIFTPKYLHSPATSLLLSNAFLIQNIAKNFSSTFFKV